MKPSHNASNEVWQSYRTELRHEQSLDTGNAQYAVYAAAGLIAALCIYLVVRAVADWRRGAPVIGNKHKEGLC